MRRHPRSRLPLLHCRLQPILAPTVLGVFDLCLDRSALQVERCGLAEDEGPFLNFLSAN